MKHSRTHIAIALLGVFLVFGVLGETLRYLAPIFNSQWQTINNNRPAEEHEQEEAKGKKNDNCLHDSLFHFSHSLQGLLLKYGSRHHLLLAEGHGLQVFSPPEGA